MPMVAAAGSSGIWLPAMAAHSLSTPSSTGGTSTRRDSTVSVLGLPFSSSRLMNAATWCETLALSVTPIEKMIGTPASATETPESRFGALGGTHAARLTSTTTIRDLQTRPVVTSHSLFCASALT